MRQSDVVICPPRFASTFGRLVALLAVCGLAAACPPRDDAIPGDAGPEEQAACAPPSSGGLVLPSLEGSPGYDEELAALDLTALPSLLAVDALSAFERELVAFMLEVDALEHVDRDAALAHPLGRAVLGAFARAADDGGVDLAFLRRGLHRFYACARGFPPTLADFKREVFDYGAEPVAEVVESRVKNLRRRIIRSAIADAFIAETLREDGTVRETEILLSGRRADSDLDFLEYGEDGALRGASSFASSQGEVTGAVPFACIACHGTRNVSPASP